MDESPRSPVENALLAHIMVDKSTLTEDTDFERTLADHRSVENIHRRTSDTKNFSESACLLRNVEEQEVCKMMNNEMMHAQAPGFIELRDVRKTYTMGETEIHALDGINFSIDQGEFVIVVGASGAGKSTILNILGGMDKATSGQMFVDGKEVSTYTPKQMTLYRRYDVGFVFQSYNLVQNLTARENVELAVQVSKNPLDVDQTIDAVGLRERKNNFPSQLSGGEQQRVAIARALAKNPKMLLCDEPTGALDYQTGKAILQLLQDTARSHNMTVIIVTHNAALTSIGDKVIRVKSGKIESISRNEHPMDIADVEW